MNRNKKQSKLYKRQMGCPMGDDTQRLLQTLLAIPHTQLVEVNLYVKPGEGPNGVLWDSATVLAAVPTFDGRHVHLDMHVTQTNHVDWVMLEVHRPDGDGSATDTWLVSPSAKNLVTEIGKLIQELPTYAEQYRVIRQAEVDLVPSHESRM